MVNRTTNQPTNQKNEFRKRKEKLKIKIKNQKQLFVFSKNFFL
jgi:hypothetical protein